MYIMYNIHKMKGFVCFDIVEMPYSEKTTGEGFFTVQDHKLEYEVLHNSEIVFIRTECDMYKSLKSYDEGNIPLYTFPVEIYVNIHEIGLYIDYTYHIYKYLKTLFPCSFNIYF